jgi:hypothetical protein
MLISMPTATSTIFGAFQAMMVSRSLMQPMLQGGNSNRCAKVRQWLRHHNVREDAQV